MTTTFNEQYHPMVLTLANDGEGVHSLLAYDYVRWVNNLGSYCNNFAQYAQSCTTNGLISNSTGVTAARFIFQMPVALPFAAKRMLWTAGMYVTASGSWTATNISAYLAKTPYAGAAGAFDFTAMDSSYLTSSDTCGYSGSGSAYKLVGSTAVGLYPLRYEDVAMPSFDTASPLVSHLVFSIAINNTAATVGVADFSCWFEHE